jgi:hypothetical protein
MQYVRKALELALLSGSTIKSYTERGQKADLRFTLENNDECVLKMSTSVYIVSLFQGYNKSVIRCEFKINGHSMFRNLSVSDADDMKEVGELIHRIQSVNEKWKQDRSKALWDQHIDVSN